MLENMKSAAAEHFDALWSWNTLERRPRHCTLDFHTKVQVWGKSLSISLQCSKHPKEYPCFKKVSDLACSKKRKKEKKREKERKKGEIKKEEKKERERKEKERKEEGKEWGRVMAPHTQAAHATNNQEPCSSSFPSLCYSTQIGTCSHAQRETYLASPIIKHCANISCLQWIWFPHMRQ